MIYNFPADVFILSTSAGLYPNGNIYTFYIELYKNIIAVILLGCTQYQETKAKKSQLCK